MIGNVWEWSEETLEDGKFSGVEVPKSGYIKAFSDMSIPSETQIDKGDPNYNNDYFWMKKTGVRGVARGGYWNNQKEAGIYSTYMVVPPSFAGVGVGFRCVK